MRNIGSGTWSSIKTKAIERNAEGDGAEHQGITPAYWRGIVWLDAGGDAEQENCQPGGEREIAEPINALAGANSRSLAQLQIGPHSAKETNGHADQEH